MNSYICSILDEMCNFIGVNPDSMNYSSDAFAQKHSWSTQEEEEFCQWLTHKLLGNKSWRSALGADSTDYTDCAHAANTFVLMFGWKVKDRKPV